MLSRLLCSTPDLEARRDSNVDDLVLVCYSPLLGEL